MYKSRYNYIILPFFTLFLFFADHLVGRSIFGYLGISILLIMVMLLDVNELFYAYALLIPNTYIMKFVGNSTALVGYWMILITLKSLFCAHGKRFSQSRLICLMLHLLCVGITIIYTGNVSILSSVVRLISFAVLTNYLAKDKSISQKKLVEMYVWGNCLNIILNLIYNFSKGINSFNGYFAGIGNDRNYFAITLVFAISILLAYIYKQKNFNLFQLIQLLILLIGGILSGSRTFVIILFVNIVLFILTISRISLVKKIVVVAVLGILILICYKVFEKNILVLYLRFQDENVLGANGRIDAWKYYLDEAFSSLPNAMFGSGGSIKDVMSGDMESVEHNTFVQMLYTIGLLGSITLFMVFYDIYRAFRKTGTSYKVNIALFFPLISILLGYSTVNGLYSDNLMFALVLSFILISLPPRESLVEKK